MQRERGHRSHSRAQAIGILLAVPLCLTLAVQPALATPGAQLWARRYSGPVKLYDEANALAVSPDGTKVFATGSSRSSPSDNDYATVAYDASTGATLWVQRFDGPAHLDDQVAAIAVSPDGSTVFVTGTSEGDYGTVAYAASNGAVGWTKRYDGKANSGSVARALGVSPDGSTVFVAGSNYGTTSSIDYATVAYEASNGTKVWARRYNGPLSSHDEANALGVSPDGSSVFVTGYSYGLTQRADYATVGYDASTGARMWVSRYAEPSNENEEALGATAVVASPDGSSVRDGQEPFPHDRQRLRHRCVRDLDRRGVVGQALRRAGRFRGAGERDRREPRRLERVRHRIQLRVFGEVRLRYRRLRRLDRHDEVDAALQRPWGRIRFCQRAGSESRRIERLRHGIQSRNEHG